MCRHWPIVVLLFAATTAWAIPGDLDFDGVVGFSDFFLFADNFGKEGPPDTLRVVVFDTTAVSVTVYDTVDVEFVLPPADLTNVSRPDQLLLNPDTGEPVQTILLVAEQGYDGDKVYVRTYYREPLDSDDRPFLSGVNYDRVRVLYSVHASYIPLIPAPDLSITPGDSVTVLRDVGFLRDRALYAAWEFDMDTEPLRFVGVASTRGDLVIDVVFRTAEQGDYAIRIAEPVRISENGKILYQTLY